MCVGELAMVECVLLRAVVCSSDVRGVARLREECVCGSVCLSVRVRESGEGNGSDERCAYVPLTS